MAAEAARREVHFVDAPVTGSAPAAAEAKLIFWVGADPADLERIRPLLLCMGNKIVHAGGHGTGNFRENGDQSFVRHGMAAFAEAMALGEGLGLSPKMLFDSLLGTPAVAPFLAAKREKIESGNYEAEFPLRWMQKDMHLASVSAYESGVAMPLTNAVKELYRLAMREGHATRDFSAIYDYLTSSHDVTTIDQRSPAPAKCTTSLSNRNISFYEDRAQRTLGSKSGTRLDVCCGGGRDRSADFRLVSIPPKGRAAETTHQLQKRIR